MTPVSAPVGRHRRIDKDRLNHLFKKDNLENRGIARKLVDAGPTPADRGAAIERKRRQIQKWRKGGGIGQRNADELAAAIGVIPEEFLVPLPTEEQLRIRRTEQLEALARELRGGHPPGSAVARL